MTMLRQVMTRTLPWATGTAVMLSSFGVEAAEQLGDEAIAQRLTSLPGWTIDDSSLICTYSFGNFVESVDFVNQLVEPSELMAHHPDVAIAYNQVTLSLTTHDAGGLTTLDFDLAEIITTVANLDGDRPCLPTL